MERFRGHLPEVHLGHLKEQRAGLGLGYLDIGPIFEKIVASLAQYRAALIAPAQGNVIDEVERMLPVVRAAHDAAFSAEREATQPVPPPAGS